MNKKTLKKINTLFNSGEYFTIAKLGNNILLKYELDIDIVYKIGFSYFEIGNYKETIKIYNLLIKKFPDNLLLLELKILVLLYLGDNKKVINILKKIDNNLLQANLMLAYGNAYRNIGKYNKSLNIFNNFLLQNKSYIIEYSIAEIYYILGKYNKALQYLNNDFLYSIDLKGKIYKKIGFSIKKLKSFYNTKINLSKEFKNDNTLIGNIYYNLENYKSSIIFYKKSLKLVSTDYYAYNGLGNCFLKLGKVFEAKKFYNQALVINKNLTYSLNSLGNIFFLEKNYEIAQKYYLKSLKINNNNFYTLKKIGDIEYKQGNLLLAKKYYLLSKNINNNQHMLNRRIKQINKKLGIIL